MLSGTNTGVGGMYARAGAESNPADTGRSFGQQLSGAELSQRTRYVYYHFPCLSAALCFATAKEAALCVARTPEGQAAAAEWAAAAPERRRQQAQSRAVFFDQLAPTEGTPDLCLNTVCTSLCIPLCMALLCPL